MSRAPKTDQRAMPPNSQEVARTIESGDQCIQHMLPIEDNDASGIELTGSLIL